MRVEHSEEDRVYDGDSERPSGSTRITTLRSIHGEYAHTALNIGYPCAPVAASQGLRELGEEFVVHSPALR